MSTGQLSEHHMDHNSQYGLQQLQRHINVRQNTQANKRLVGKRRQHPYHAAAAAGAKGSTRRQSTSGRVIRRISRACDQCNQLRTKCDGQNPCAHCVELGLHCEYIRECKKRGKAPRKDPPAKAAAQNRQKSPTDQSPGARSLSESLAGNGYSNGGSSTNEQETHSTESTTSMSDANGSSMPNGTRKARKSSTRARSVENLVTDLQPHSHQALTATCQDDDLQGPIDNPTDIWLNGYGQTHGYRPAINDHLITNTHMSYDQSAHYDTPSSLPTYGDLPYSIQRSQNYPPPAQSPPGEFRLGESPLPGFQMDSPDPTPEWYSMPSPSRQYHIGYRHTSTSPRYPELQPLIPHLGNIVPLSLACDLLDLYFASSSSALMHPMSPYVLGYVFRKKSFLHPTKPRAFSPALLSSMLWVAAQTSDAVLLTAPPSARGRVCQQLFELTISLLKPLMHGSPVGYSSPNFSDTMIDGVAMGGEGAFGASGQLDDVVTYIHLATVMSAGEYKGASLRWWNAAWSLARELKLGRELPPSQPVMHQHEVNATRKADDNLRFPSTGPSEEEREERRRIWWLVYTIDRHLSLCYNKPLFLLDVECDDLLQPMDDTLWQSGEFNSRHSSVHSASPNGSAHTRRRGPHFECTGHSIFGYFLPLMTILGEIVDLNHARNHPRLGVGFRSAQEWDGHANEIGLQLEAYGRSLKEFEERHLGALDNTNKQENIIDPETGMSIPGPLHTHEDLPLPSNHSVDIATSRINAEFVIQTRIVLAYGTHVMHVLHILLTGKWDPISLLDDNNLWISSQSFIDAAGHAISAAEALESILEVDPGLEFMPFFFGVYLLQGSFLLLLIADKLQNEASPSVVKACETIVRAHEACVVTLNTEYQRNFRKVMRSALAQVRGRVPEDIEEQQLRRLEVLSLYRWTGDGTGLAL